MPPRRDCTISSTLTLARRFNLTVFTPRGGPDLARDLSLFSKRARVSSKNEWGGQMKLQVGKSVCQDVSAGVSMGKSGRNTNRHNLDTFVKKCKSRWRPPPIVQCLTSGALPPTTFFFLEVSQTPPNVLLMQAQGYLSCPTVLRSDGQHMLVWVCR